MRSAAKRREKTREIPQGWSLPANHAGAGREASRARPQAARGGRNTPTYPIRPEQPRTIPCEAYRPAHRRPNPGRAGRGFGYIAAMRKSNFALALCAALALAGPVAAANGAPKAPADGATKTASAAPESRPRVRDWGIKIGVLPAGPFDALTDVAGVRS